MQRKLIFLAMAAVAAAPIALAAQDTTAPAPRVRRAPRVARGFAYAMGENRGRIGVIVRTDANTESDKVGAKIEAVTPGGPADKAGLKVGDIITKFNGTSLGGVPSDDDEESGPGKKLVELAHQLDPGDTVQVEYRRGSDTKKATVVAAKLGDGRFRMEMGDPGIMVMPGMPDMHDMPDMNFDFFVSPWGDLKLVSLNPDLGDYFGTKEGILVVKAPADSSLPLKGGDVIISIGGRKPSSPEHAMRILRSYDKGETVSIEILRKQKRMTVAWRVPSRDDRLRVREERHEHERDEQSAWRRPARQRLRLQRV
ncbi:MAG TPA: PDZ domain-containing protein [Gemmatimonadales bacterium]|nr:PDZ domain-containing protein [Gemmatimonadales bacterium]